VGEELHTLLLLLAFNSSPLKTHFGEDDSP